MSYEGLLCIGYSNASAHMCQANKANANGHLTDAEQPRSTGALRGFIYYLPKLLEHIIQQRTYSHEVYLKPAAEACVGEVITPSGTEACVTDKACGIIGDVICQPA